MAGAIVEVNGVEASLFKDTDPPIYLMPDGRFAMRYGGLWKVRSSMAPLLKMIGRFNTPVKMMRTDRLYEPSVCGPSEPKIIDAVSWERGILGLQDGKRIKERYMEWYHYDAKIEAELRTLYKEAHALDMAHCKAMGKLVKRHQAICKRMKPIREGSFKAVVAEIDSTRPRSTSAKVVRRAQES